MPTMFKVLLFVRKHPTLLQSNFVHLCRVRFALLEKGIDFQQDPNATANDSGHPTAIFKDGTQISGWVDILLALEVSLRR